MIKRKRRPKLNLQQVSEYFRARGCILLTKKYLHSKQKLDFICRCGARGKACFNSFSRYRCCKACAARENNYGINKEKKEIRSNHLSLAEMARTLKVDYSELRSHVIAGNLPKPTHYLFNGIKPYYNKKDIQRIKEKIE